MRADELRQFVRATPFVPFRLHISNGQHVDVVHPEMAMVSKSLVAVGIAGRDGEVDHFLHFNLLHIVKIEMLNGQRSETPSPSQSSDE